MTEPRIPTEHLEAAVARVHAEGKAAFPDVTVSTADLTTRLGQLVPDGKPVLETLGELRGADVYLAFACGAGDARALAHFEALYATDLERAFRRASPQAIAFEDFAQTLRKKLFAPPAPRIREYGGRGDLRAWLRVVATRTILDMSRPTHLKERPTADAEFLAVPAPSDAPDVAYLKRLYGEEVTQAIEDAARALEPEQRNVLRDTYARGLTIDQIGKIHGIHRATAARRVQRARDSLLAETRRLLAERLGLSDSELDSVLRLAESQIQITMSRVFA